MSIETSTSPSFSSRIGRPGFPAAEVRDGEILSQLIHKVGHEIGNPLTAIISLSTILERFPLDSSSSDKLASYAASIIDEAWRISSLNERLVLLLSSRTGNVAPCDVGPLLTKALSKYKSRTKRKNFAIDMAPLLPGGSTVIADAEQLVQLFVELLSNAHQGMLYPDEDAGHAMPSYRCGVTVTPEDKFVEISVRNRIDGAVPFDLNDLFRPLVTKYEDRKHVGLGLTVAHSIVERLDGTIQVLEQIDENGAAFTVSVRLPRAV